jgi:hypothetical protein
MSKSGDPFFVLMNMIIGFFSSLVTFIVLVFVLDVFLKFYIAGVPEGSPFYYKGLVDIVAFLVDFANPVSDFVLAICFFIMGLLFSLVSMFATSGHGGGGGGYSGR